MLEYSFAQTAEEVQEIENFAHSIDHRITKKHPVIGVRNGKGLIGFIEVVNEPVLLSGWKKGMGKDCIRAIKGLSKKFKEEHGISYSLCPLTSPLYKKMERLGFGNTTFVIFKKL